MPFIGKQSTSNSQITNYTTTVGSGGQTNFTVVIEGGDETHVYLNGVLLKETTDYTVSSTQVSLVSPAVENDIVEIKVFRRFALADAVRASDGGTFSGDVTVPNLIIGDGGNIGSASDTNAISIASDGGLTFSGGIDNAGTISAGTIGGGVAMASSGMTLRNVTQIALASDQGVSGSSALTTYFSPTYTNLFSGSKVQGALTFMGNAINTNGHDARAKFIIDFQGSNITNITFERHTRLINFGGYDYGGNGLQAIHLFTVFGPLITTSNVATITANCQLKMNVSTNTQFNVYGDGTGGETHFTWFEYK